MRTRQTSKRGLTVQAVAGTFVVLLGFSVEAEQCKGLLGFAIHRTDLTENQSYWLSGGITFPGMTATQTSSLVDFPLQRFRWGDYTAKPAHHYQYQIQAMYGKPGALVAGDSIAVDVHTEDPLSIGNGKHQVHFNRSAAASQAYVRMFGDKDPQDIPDGAAFRWLSRGLEESLIAFINRATDASYALYLSVYEFQKDDFLDALFQATQRKVHVEIVYDDIPNASGPHEANQAAIKKHQLDPFCHPRKNIPSISHNKFIVLVKNNQPLAVWTGSTNFTDGAIYGQANVGHAIEDSELAATYWKLQQNLLKDPDITDSRKEAVMLTPVPPAMDAKLGPPAEYPIFSPRTNDVALDVCAKLMREAKQLVCFTAPFGLDPKLNAVLDDVKDQFLAFGLLNKADSSVEATHRTVNDRFVSPAHIETKLDQFQKESLHHKGVYIHTKYILIDPLSANPVLVTGSANFSHNSSVNNDENQLIIADQPAVVDVYLGEFMRMYDHYMFRFYVEQGKEKSTGLFLSVDDSWTEKYYTPGLEQKDRLLFAGC